MNNLTKSGILCGLLLTTTIAMGQNGDSRDLQQYRSPDQTGINEFEALGDNGVEFDKVKVRVGGAFAIQFQALDHSTGLADTTLPSIGSNLNLPTANFDLDVALADGMRMHIRTYLSSRHHSEAWVKGGYLQIDKLDFIKEDFLKSIMDITTVKVGMMEVNYGDYHFRRSDNARAIYNPFVGNLIMDAFTTEPGVEIYVTPGDFLIMGGLTNGKLNQSVSVSDNPDVTNGPAILGKVGWDRQINDDLRLRLTSSIYTIKGAARNTLYGGDRAGSRFYQVINADDDFSGRFNPGLSHELTAIMINPFVKFHGLEFLGVIEMSSGKGVGETDARNWNQYAGELLYRFGAEEKVYVGAKYNMVSGKLASGEEVDLDRLEAGAGWYMTKNVMVKAEYVVQNNNGIFGPQSLLNDSQFSGAMLEAVISF